MEEYKITAETLTAIQRIVAREEEFRRKLYGENYKSVHIDMKEILGYDPSLNLTPEEKATIKQTQLNKLNHQIAAEIALMRAEEARRNPEIIKDHKEIPTIALETGSRKF